MDPLTIAMLGTSIFGAVNAGKQKGQAGGGGGIYVHPEYSWTQPQLKAIADHNIQTISSIDQGGEPLYWSRAKKKIQAGLDRGVQQTFFGTQGYRQGSVQAGLEASSALGVGPKAGAANVNRTLQRYEDANKAIDEFIAKTGVDVTQDALKTSIYSGIQAPRGPEVTAYGGYGATAAPGNDWMASVGSGLASTLGSFKKQLTTNTTSMPWEDTGYDWEETGIIGSQQPYFNWSTAPSTPSFSSKTSAAPAQSPSWVTDNYSLDFLGRLFNGGK